VTPTQQHPENSPNFQNAHGVVMLTETSKLLPWLMMCCLLSGFACALATGSIIWASMSARETKQLQIQVMDQNALLIREGLKQPGDTVYGPAGNLEYKPREKK